MTSTKANLIYLPGLEGTGKLLFTQADLYADYNVFEIAYPQDREVSYEDLADLAAKPLQQAGPGIVLAESFGGGVALTLALRYPELVERMILVNTFAYFLRRPVIELLSWVAGPLPDRPSHPATRKIREMFFFSPDVPSSTRDEWWKLAGTVPMSAMGRRIVLIRDLDLRARLANISIPSLVLTANDDRIVAPAAGKDIAKRLPRAKLLEKRVAHAALVHPEVNVAEWLAEKQYWQY